MTFTTQTAALVVLLGLVTSTSGSCSNTNWWKSFDNEGLSKCAGSRYLRGFYRNDARKDDPIYLLEEANCCTPTPGQSWSAQIVYADWWGSFDKNNRWNVCPNGFFLQGLYRTGGSKHRLWNIEEGRCMKPVTHPYRYGHCYEEDITFSFDKTGWSKCRDGYYITGLYRGGCDKLYCLEKLKCCKMIPRPDTLDSLQKVKTMVMDKTMSRLALLAHYLGYGWCSGCRAPWVGEDFRRNGDTWEADKSGRCKGFKNKDRLNINYGHWKFAIKDIRYGQPVITSLQPESIDTGIATNDSPTESRRTISRREESIRSVTHTVTSSWTKSHELGVEINYNPPSATGGVGGSVSYKFGYESSSSTTDSEQKTQKNILTVNDSKILPAYSSTNVTLILSKTRTTVPYTATIIAQFSAELRGFLRWGGGRNNPGTNYHYQHRGSGDRPTFNYRFGNGDTPFYEALKHQSSTMQRPWEWGDLMANHRSAQSVINQLTSERQYEFKLTGKFDDVIGKRMDVIWQQIPFRGRKRRAATPQENGGNVITPQHQSIAQEKPGDAAVFPPPPEVDLGQGQAELQGVDEPVLVTNNV